MGFSGASDRTASVQGAYVRSPEIRCAEEVTTLRWTIIEFRIPDFGQVTFKIRSEKNDKNESINWKSVI